jgi:hypothetical protein
VTTRGSNPCVSSSSITPMWNRPWEAPPLSNKAERPKLRAARLRKRRFLMGGSCLTLDLQSRLRAADTSSR